jgi:hypothetical protein
LPAGDVIYDSRQLLCNQKIELKLTILMK